MLVIYIGDYGISRPVIEKTAIGFVSFANDELPITMASVGTKVVQFPAHQESGVEARVNQYPADHRRSGGLQRDAGGVSSQRPGGFLSGELNGWMVKLLDGSGE